MSNNKQAEAIFIVINGYLHKLYLSEKFIKISDLMALAGVKSNPFVTRMLDDVGEELSTVPNHLVEIEDGDEFLISENRKLPANLPNRYYSESDKDNYIGDDLATQSYGPGVYRNDKHMVVKYGSKTLVFHWSDDFDWKYFQELFIRARDLAVKQAYEDGSWIIIVDEVGFSLEHIPCLDRDGNNQRNESKQTDKQSNA